MTYSMKSSFLAAVASTALCGVEGRKNLHTPYHQKSAPLGHWNASCARGTPPYNRCHRALKEAGLKANGGTAERLGMSRDMVRSRVCQTSGQCSETCQTSTLCKPRGEKPVATAIQRLLAAGKNKETRKMQSKLGNRQSTVVKDDALSYFYFDWYVKQNNGDVANFRKAALAAFGILDDVMTAKHAAPNYADYWLRNMVGADDDFEKAVAGFDANLKLVVEEAVAEMGPAVPAYQVAHRVNEMMQVYPDAGAKVTTELGFLSDMLPSQSEQEALVRRVANGEKIPCTARSSTMQSYLTDKGIHGFFYMIAKNLKQKAERCDNMACVAELYFNGNRHHWLKLGPVLKCDPLAQNCIESEAEKKNDQLRKTFAFRGNDLQEKGRWKGLEKGFNKKNQGGFLSQQTFKSEEDVLKLQVGEDFLKLHEDELSGQCVEGTGSFSSLSSMGSFSSQSSSSMCSQQANETCRKEVEDQDTRNACCQRECTGLVSPVWRNATHTLEELAFPKFGAGFGTPESKAGGISPVDGVDFKVYPAEYYKKFTEQVVPKTAAWVDVWAQKKPAVTHVAHRLPTTNKQTYWVEHQWKGVFANTRNPSPWLSNPAEMFRMCNVPWVGGVSGSSIEMIKLVDGYFGLADRFHEGSVLAIAASYNAFGFHSISEVFAATYAWGYWNEHFPRQADQYTVPFDVNTTKGDLMVAAVTGLAWDDTRLSANRELQHNQEAGYAVYKNLVKDFYSSGVATPARIGDDVADMFDKCPRFGGQERGQYLGEAFYNLGEKEMETKFEAKMAELEQNDLKNGGAGWTDMQKKVCLKRFDAVRECRDRQSNWYYRMVKAAENIMERHDTTWTQKNRPSKGPSQKEVDEMLMKSQAFAHLSKAGDAVVAVAQYY